MAGLTFAAGLAACSSAPAAPAAGAATAASGSTAATSSSPSPAPAKSGHSRSTGNGKTIAGLITFKGKFQLHGASSRLLSFRAFPGVTSPASSCAKLAAKGTLAARGEQPLFKIPAPPAGGTVFFTAEVMPYHGPGTYSKAAIVAAGADITVGGATYNPRAAQATTSVTFNADGSGTFTFAHAPASKPGKPDLSGTVRWTCGG